jgi:phosphatidylglycerophosphate synthase
MGALLFLAHSILDGCDGELARLKFQQSRLGGVLDFWGDNVVHAVIFGCMAAGWSLAAGAAWPLFLGAAAVFGTLGSAGFVFWRLMRAKDGGGALFTSVSAEPERPLARLLDAASRRDFIS